MALVASGSSHLRGLIDRGLLGPAHGLKTQWTFEMQVEDPDGHDLRLGAEPRADRPFDCVGIGFGLADPGGRAVKIA